MCFPWHKARARCVRCFMIFCLILCIHDHLIVKPQSHGQTPNPWSIPKAMVNPRVNPSPHMYTNTLRNPNLLASDAAAANLPTPQLLQPPPPPQTPPQTPLTSIKHHFVASLVGVGWPQTFQCTCINSHHCLRWWAIQTSIFEKWPGFLTSMGNWSCFL